MTIRQRSTAGLGWLPAFACALVVRRRNRTLCHGQSSYDRLLNVLDEYSCECRDCVAAAGRSRAARMIVLFQFIPASVARGRPQ